jgi:hypothetical protein
MVVGCSDFFIPLIAKGKGGFWLELKRRGVKKIPTHQLQFIVNMVEHGYAGGWAAGAEDAMKAIRGYLYVG